MQLQYILYFTYYTLCMYHTGCTGGEHNTKNISTVRCSAVQQLCKAIVCCHRFLCDCIIPLTVPLILSNIYIKGIEKTQKQWVIVQFSMVVYFAEGTQFLYFLRQISSQYFCKLSNMFVYVWRLYLCPPCT